jgi:hypothetical protein
LHARIGVDAHRTCGYCDDADDYGHQNWVVVDGLIVDIVRQVVVAKQTRVRRRYVPTSSFYRSSWWFCDGVSKHGFVDPRPNVDAQCLAG